GAINVSGLEERFASRTLVRSILDRKRLPPEFALPKSATDVAAAADLEVTDILSLRSCDRARIVDVLSRDEGPTAALVPHTIPVPLTLAELRRRAAQIHAETAV